MLPAVLDRLKQYLQTEYQERLAQVVLYGSQARKQATKDSDIDVLIVLNDPVDPGIELQRTSQAVAELCLENDLLISRLFIGRSRYETEQSPLLRNIRREGIVL
ncbi:nucleotidyltransferase domain-containing protein [Synechococcus elongatus]|uniref:nucleotidyltransferase domain-containing protein n=1 Tax=Synechococcus elongatus TaxID=32046 RepID=UPI0030D20689